MSDIQKHIGQDPDHGKGKFDPYHVPEGYFEGLTDRIMERVTKEKRNRIKEFVYRPIFMYAAAAASVIIIVGTLFFTRFDDPASPGPIQVSITDNGYITDFLLYEINENEFYELVAAFDQEYGFFDLEPEELTEEEIIIYLSQQEYISSESLN